VQQLISRLGVDTDFGHLILGKVRSFLIAPPRAVFCLTAFGGSVLFVGMLFGVLDHLLGVDLSRIVSQELGGGCYVDQGLTMAGERHVIFVM
jgi:hypothetical protein